MLTGVIAGLSANSIYFILMASVLCIACFVVIRPDFRYSSLIAANSYIPLNIMLISAAGIVAYIRKECDFGISWPLAEDCCRRLKMHIDTLDFSDRENTELLKAVICGDKSGLSEESLEIFRKSGASHLLALSGLHLGIIYMCISRLLAFLKFRKSGQILSSALIMALCGFYTIASGASDSIVRAFIFICLRESAKICERNCTILHCLCMSLLIQLGISPVSVMNAGFQLSYLAMLGIAVIHPYLSSLYPESRTNFGIMRKIWESASLSISCQCFTAPLAWKLFHSFPTCFLLTNLLAMPLMSLCMLGSLICLGISFFDGGCQDFAVMATEKTFNALRYILGVICQIQ